MKGAAQNLPEGFIQQMTGLLGDDVNPFLSIFDQPAPVSIRANPKKPSGLVGQPVPWCSHGLYLPERPRFTLDPTLHAGAYYVQEASSMFLEQAFRQSVDLSKPLRVLDLCGAPGGKSTHCLGLLSDESLLVANEPIRARAEILKENIHKWGYNNVVVTQNDPERFQQLPGFFDIIVVDAPCSGEGLFRKDPKAMEEWSPSQVTLCSQRQRRIVRDCWPALAEGGILIYSTCTFNPEENENNLRWLSENNNVEFLDIKTESHWNIETVMEKNIRGYRFYPHRTRGEGFFMSVIKKNEKTGPIYTPHQSKNRKAPLNVPDEIKRMVKTPSEKTFFETQQVFSCFPSNHAPFMDILQSTLRIMALGTELALIKHNKTIPLHNVALSVEFNPESFPSIAVNEENALRYLRKENLDVDEAKGFHRITYKGLGLGWANVLEKRINNLYPVSWRIRM